MAFLDFLNPLSAITDGIVKWQIAKENAKNDTERIRADTQIATLEAKRDVQVAATIHDKWYSPRTLLGYIVVVFLFKLFIWDTVLGWGVTQYPGSLIMEITNTVVAFYFVSEGLQRIFKRG